MIWYGVHKCNADSGVWFSVVLDVDEVCPYEMYCQGRLFVSDFLFHSDTQP